MAYVNPYQAVGLVCRGQVVNDVKWDPGSIRTIIAAQHYFWEKSIPKTKGEIPAHAGDSLARRITPLGYFAENDEHSKVRDAMKCESFKKEHPRLHQLEYHAPRPGEEQTEAEKQLLGAIARFSENPGDSVFQWQPPPRTIASRGPSASSTLVLRRPHLQQPQPFASAPGARTPRGHLLPLLPAPMQNPVFMPPPMPHPAYGQQAPYYPYPPQYTRAPPPHMQSRINAPHGYIGGQPPPSSLPLPGHRRGSQTMGDQSQHEPAVQVANAVLGELGTIKKKLGKIQDGVDNLESASKPARPHAESPLSGRALFPYHKDSIVLKAMFDKAMGANVKSEINDVINDRINDCDEVQEAMDSESFSYPILLVADDMEAAADFIKEAFLQSPDGVWTVDEEVLTLTGDVTGIIYVEEYVEDVEGSAWAALGMTEFWRFELTGRLDLEVRNVEFVIATNNSRPELHEVMLSAIASLAANLSNVRLGTRWSVTNSSAKTWFVREEPLAKMMGALEASDVRVIVEEVRFENQANAFCLGPSRIVFRKCEFSGDKGAWIADPSCQDRERPFCIEYEKMEVHIDAICISASNGVLAGVELSSIDEGIIWELALKLRLSGATLSFVKTLDECPDGIAFVCPDDDKIVKKLEECVVEKGGQLFYIPLTASNARCKNCFRQWQHHAENPEGWSCCHSHKNGPQQKLLKYAQDRAKR